MSAVFGDTSALFALVNPRDDNHVKARRAFARLAARQAQLASTSAVLTETYALVGHRLGLDAARAFRIDFAPLLDVTWVDESLHEAGLDLWLDRQQRQLSLVDAISFLAMRRLGLTEAFAFDPHFQREGFTVIGP